MNVECLAPVGVERRSYCDGAPCSDTFGTIMFVPDGLSGRQKCTNAISPGNRSSFNKLRNKTLSVLGSSKNQISSAASSAMLQSIWHILVCAKLIFLAPEMHECHLASISLTGAGSTVFVVSGCRVWGLAGAGSTVFVMSGGSRALEALYL